MNYLHPSKMKPNSIINGRLLAILALALMLPAMLQCRGIGGYKSIIFSKAKLATPPTTLSQRDYPFDEKGRYRTDWVKSGSTKSRSKSSFRAAPTATPTPKKQTIAKTSSGSQSKTNKTSSSSSMTVASNSTKPSKTTAPPVYTPAPAPKPKPKPPAPQKKSARYHTIAKGDTLWDISRRYKVSISEIKSANGLSSDLIRPGQTLRLP